MKCCADCKYYWCCESDLDICELYMKVAVRKIN